MNKFVNIKTQLSQNALPISSTAQTIYALIKINPVDFPSGQKIPLDLRMVLDKSGSMGSLVSQYSSKNCLDLLKEACSNAAGMMQKDDRITVYSFSDRSKLELKPTVIKNGKDHDRIRNAIKNIRLAGSTHLSTSLKEMLKVSAINNNYLQRALIFTDGEVNVPSTASEEKACLALAGNAKKMGIPFWVYGTGISYAEDFLKKLAAVSGGSFEHISDPNDMLSLFSDQMQFFKDVAVTNAEISIDAIPGIILRKVSRVIPDIEVYSHIQPTYFSSDIPDIDRVRGAALLLQLEIAPVFDKPVNAAYINLRYDVPSLGLKAVEQNAELEIDFTDNASSIMQNGDVLDIVTLQGAHTLATLGAQAAETGNAQQGVTLMQQAAALYNNVGAADMATQLMTLSNSVSSQGSITGSSLNTKRTLTTVSRKMVTQRVITNSPDSN